MQQFIPIFVALMFLLFFVVLYNQLKIMKKISRIEKFKDRSSKNKEKRNQEIDEHNPLVAAAIMAAINLHKQKKG